MIVDWISSIFDLLGFSLPSQLTLFGMSFSLSTLTLIVFLILIIFFTIEIITGVSHFFKKLYTF